MSTKRLFLAVALFLGLAVTSCSKEQSELSLSSVDGTAIATGTITYCMGYMVEGTSYTNDYFAPVSNQTIFVDVALSQYDSGASGTKRYTTTTGADGTYTVTIPCSVSMGTVKITVKVPSFTAYYSYMSNNVLEADDSALYENGSAGTAFTLYSGDQKVCNVKVDGPTSATAK